MGADMWMTFVQSNTLARSRTLRYVVELSPAERGNKKP